MHEGSDLKLKPFPDGVWVGDVRGGASSPKEIGASLGGNPESSEGSYQISKIQDQKLNPF